MKSQELMEDVAEKLGEVQQIANENTKASINAVEEEKDEKTTVEQIQQQQEKAEQSEEIEKE